VNYENERGKFMELSQNYNKQILEEDTELIEDYIETSGQDFTQTSYGFWISNSGKASESMAKSGDYIKFEYEVSDFDGNTVYSKEEIGVQQIYLGKTHLPRGLHTTLQLIEEGDSATALYPSFLAYGGYGDRNKVGGYVPLIFNVKIIDIKK
jgi:gliding motility-associated peptidyl-prolyl isomerase